MQSILSRPSGQATSTAIRVNVNVTVTERERKHLARLEAVIDKGLQTFVEVGVALAEIRDACLFREHYDTFREYCQGRWGFSDSRARQLITAAKVQDRIAGPKNGQDECKDGNESVTQVTVPSERIARELNRLPEDQQADAWQETVKKANGSPTAADTREVVDSRLETIKPCSNCGSTDRDEDEDGTYCRQCNEPLTGHPDYDVTTLKVARMFEVPPAMVLKGKEIQDKDPALGDLVLAGKIGLDEALQKVRDNAAAATETIDSTTTEAEETIIEPATTTEVIDSTTTEATTTTDAEEMIKELAFDLDAFKRRAQENIDALKSRHQAVFSKIDSGELSGEDAMRELVNLIRKGTEIQNRYAYGNLCTLRSFALFAENFERVAGGTVFRKITRALGIKSSFLQKLKWFSTISQEDIDAYSDQTRDADGEISAHGLWRWAASGNACFTDWEEETAEAVKD